MFKIYGLHTPMFVKTVLAAEEIGAPYQVIEVDLMKGEQKQPEHLRRHSFGKVPALEHNGNFLFESNAITRYMAEVTNSSLYPKALYERALVDQWVDYFSLQAGRWCTNIWFEKCIAPKYFNDLTDEKLVKDSTEWLLEVMPIIDAHLGNNQWLAGGNVSLADINAFMLMRGYSAAGLNLNDFRHFTRWFSDFSKRQAVQKIEKWL